MRTPYRLKVKHSLGMSIVEIMVALAISLLLLGGVIQIYQSTRSANNTTENLSRTQENGRFAVSMLLEGIRSTGFTPCLKPGKIANVVVGGGGIDPNQIFDAPISGYEGNASVFPADFPVAGAAPGNRIASSDGIIVNMTNSNPFTVLAHDTAAATFTLNSVQNLKANNFAIICKLEQVAIFQITAVDDNAKTVQYAVGAGVPGNCDIKLGGTGDCTQPASLTVEEYATKNDSQVISIGSAAYYIGVSSDGASTSLYRSIAGGATEELVEGIESMQILYGVNTDNVILPEPVADQYVTADVVDAAGNWARVISIRMGLLTATPDEINFQEDTRAYNVAGTLIGTASAVAHPQDRRSRYVFSSTIRLRNKIKGRML